MESLPDSVARVVAALIRASIAWQTPAELAEALLGDVDEVCDLVADLDVAGWVDVWEADIEQGPVVTLTAAAASRLGLRLVEAGPDELPRWVGAGDPEPPAPRARHVARSARAAALDAFPDPSPPPDVAAQRAEAEAVRSPGPDPDAWPRPTRLVGQGLTPWPGPDPRPGPAATCPACHGRPLSPSMYCIRCDRWGLDPARPSGLPAASGPAQGPRAARWAAPAEEGRDAEMSRARRKHRRRSKMDARKRADSASAAGDARGRPDPPAGSVRRDAPAPCDFGAPPRRPDLGPCPPATRPFRRDRRGELTGETPHRRGPRDTPPAC